MSGIAFHALAGQGFAPVLGCADAQCAAPSAPSAPSAPPDPGRGKRLKRTQYTTAAGVRTWDGKRFLCEHGKRRSTCKACGGASLCEHGRQRSQCKDCGGGSQICEHGKRRGQCKDCGGASICEHGRQRSTCKACGGSSVCEHGRQRSKCKACGGRSICEHGRVRSQCKACGGGSICEHGRNRSKCKDCGGGAICEHGRQRYECSDCGGGCRGGLHGKCPEGHTGRSKYDGHCVRCFCDAFPNDPRADEAKKYKGAKEQAVRAFLETAFPDYRWVFNRAYSKQMLQGTLRRPDAKTVLGKTRVILVEVDEHSHDTYTCGDERERERLFRLHTPRDAVVYVLRFNPDAYDHPVTGARVPTCFRYSKVEGVVTVHPNRQGDWAFRLETLRKTIQEIFDHRHVAVEVPPCIAEEEDQRHTHCVPIELFYDDVVAKYGLSGNAAKLAALKQAAAATATETAATAAVGQKRPHAAVADEVESDTTDD